MNPLVIFGGAGFLGTNLAARLASTGRQVRVVDDLSSPTSALNAAWLREHSPGLVEIVTGDVHDQATVTELVAEASAVVHFDANLAGTFNVLQALRGREVPLLFASTREVYGALAGLPLEEGPRRWEPTADLVRSRGISEAAPLQFTSPRGCSTGAADQYVLDHADCYGMPNVVFRMSCSYGPHQFGDEERGFVSRLTLGALAGEPLTIYGDGKQVRDVLYVDDVVEACLAAVDGAWTLAGRAFNLGGSPRHTLSLLELVEHLERICGRKLQVRFEPARPGDQRFYVSDTRAFEQASGWIPRTNVAEGLRALADWLIEHHPRLAPQRSEPRHRGQGAATVYER